MMSCEKDFRVGQQDGTPQLVDGPVLFRPTSWSPVWCVLFLCVYVVGVRLGGGCVGGCVHSDTCLTCDAPCQITCMIFMDFIYSTNLFVLTSCKLSVFMNPF